MQSPTTSNTAHPPSAPGGGAKSNVQLPRKSKPLPTKARHKKRRTCRGATRSWRYQHQRRWQNPPVAWDAIPTARRTKPKGNADGATKWSRCNPTRCAPAASEVLYPIVQQELPPRRLLRHPQRDRREERQTCGGPRGVSTSKGRRCGLPLWPAHHPAYPLTDGQTDGAAGPSERILEQKRRSGLQATAVLTPPRVRRAAGARAWGAERPWMGAQWRRCGVARNKGNKGIPRGPPLRGRAMPSA